uniref:Uncharacterized protein n=2 Tax=gambiae species complex TaxID=44542 RepID=A0A453YZN5_ANOGA
MGEKMGKVLAAIPALNGSISTINFSIKLLIYCLMVLNVKTFGLKCVCNPDECDIIRPEDCPGKGYIVWDPCKCCKVCARTLGELAVDRAVFPARVNHHLAAFRSHRSVVPACVWTFPRQAPMGTGRMVATVRKPC